MLIFRILQKYMEHPMVKTVFYYLRPAVTGLIAAAGFSVLRMAVLTGGGEGILGTIDWKALVFYGVILFLTQWKKTKSFHPIAFIGCGAVIGLLLF